MSAAPEAIVRRREGLGRGVWAVLLIAAAVAAWFSLRNALHTLIEREYPLMGAAISPASPVSQATMALNRVTNYGGTVDRVAHRLAVDALHRAPLMADPLIVAGMEASALDDVQRARAAFEEVKRRDPRSVIARYWLFDYYLRSGLYAEGIAEAGPLIRLQPASATPVTAILTALLDVPEARPALVAALRSRPVWRQEFFRQMGANPRLTAVGAELLALSTAGAETGGARDQQAVIRSLVRRGDYAGARALWMQLLPAESGARAVGVYDGDFEGWPGAAPFNWRLSGERSGVVRRLGAGGEGKGLGIRHDANRAAMIAEQLIMPAPGPHALRFTVQAREEQSQGDGGIAAVVRCAAGNARLGAAVAPHPATTPATQTLSFTMPATCPAALVQFAVKPGVTPGPLDVVLSNVVLSAQ